jgi:hypothetical protein
MKRAVGSQQCGAPLLLYVGCALRVLCASAVNGACCVLHGRASDGLNVNLALKVLEGMPRFSKN